MIADTGNPTIDQDLAFRVRALIAARYLLRITHAARRVYGLRFKECEVLFAVGVASVRPAPTPGAQADERPISRLAIAESTGINRETVRRCLQKLAESGWITLTDEGASMVRHDRVRPEHREYWDYVIRQMQLANAAVAVSAQQGQTPHIV